MNIEHVALNHPDPAGAAQWYTEHVGMQVVRSSDQSPFIHFLADTAKTGLIELYNNPAADVPDYPAQSSLIVHIAFSVDDIEGTRARLIEAGATAEGEITQTPVGDQLAMLRDPWGVPLQLAKRAKPMV